MKIIDERIQKQEVKDLSAELIENLVQALDEDYNVFLDNGQKQTLEQEFAKVLSKFFNLKV
jgi:ribosomal protein S17E